MKDEYVVGVIVASVLFVAMFAASSTLSYPHIPAGNAYSTLQYGGLDAGGFAVEPKQFGGEIRSSSPSRGFVGRAIETDMNNCWKCEYDGVQIGYSAEMESAAKKACAELGGKLTYWHDGSCSNVEAMAR